jgi:heme/copper-type cytochrome/quinol oxidase subunit 2
MFGTVVAMTQSDWDDWMASELAAISPAADKATDVAAATDQPSAESIIGGKS